MVNRETSAKRATLYSDQQRRQKLFDFTYSLMGFWAIFPFIQFLNLKKIWITFPHVASNFTQNEFELDSVLWVVRSEQHPSVDMNSTLKKLLKSSIAKFQYFFQTHNSPTNAYFHFEALLVPRPEYWWSNVWISLAKKQNGGIAETIQSISTDSTSDMIRDIGDLCSRLYSVEGWQATVENFEDIKKPHIKCISHCTWRVGHPYLT